MNFNRFFVALNTKHSPLRPEYGGGGGEVQVEAGQEVPEAEEGGEGRQRERERVMAEVKCESQPIFFLLLQIFRQT